MGLQKGEAGQTEEVRGKIAERIEPDEFEDGSLKRGLHGCKEPLPLPPMLFKELLPAEEGLQGNVKHLADSLDRADPEGVLSQDAEDKEQAVPAVGDDRIREHSVRGRTLTPAADQATDTQTDLHRPPIDEFDQGSAIVAVDTHLTSASTARTGFGSRAEMIHTTLKNGFSGSFFTNKLAIDQVLSYHNSALRTMRSLEIRAMTLLDAWSAWRKNGILAENGFFLLFYCLHEEL